MENVQALLELPVTTLVVLVCGYLGYRVAYAGKDGAHRAVDTAFIALSFGLAAKLAYSQTIFSVPGDTGKAALALTVTLVSASLWRKWGEELMRRALRATSVSFSDGHKTAWDTIRLSTSDRPTQIVVRKKDGSQIMCDYLRKYEKMPHGPCVYGADGSIALYVTNFRGPAAETWEKSECDDPDYGVAMTYVPASQIDEIEVRNLFSA